MKRKTELFYIIVLIIITSPRFLDAAGLGVNISLPERGGTFVNLVKEHHRWLNPNSWTALEAGDFDEQGWPVVNALFMMDMRPVAEWAGKIDDPDDYRVDMSGTYTGIFTGKANVQSWGEGEVTNVSYDNASNTTTFNLNVGEPGEEGYGFFVLAFLETQRNPDDELGCGILDLKLIRPDYLADTDQTFTDAFIDALTNPKFSTIRFKDFTRTDGADPDYPGVMEWADRSLPSHASQQRIEEIDKRSGAAWEYVIELANLVEIDPWINVPVSATTDYITELATMFKENLNPNLNIYVESSNEVWNTAPGYEQSQYNQAQAASLGIGEHNNHARRTIEIAQIFESVFGAGSLNSKIRVVLCSHAPMLKWWVNPLLEYSEATFGPPNRYIYALACQSYFTGGADAGESVDKILADCRESITEQMDEKTGNQSGRLQWIAKAANLGLVGGFCFYEGGPDHGGGSTVNLDNRIDAERSEGMGQVFKYNYKEGFFDLGGNIGVQFTLTSAYNRYGCWGLTDDINEPDRNYKFQAARELIDYLSSVDTRETITEFQLLNNYPNPFNPSTTIEYVLDRTDKVKLTVHNILGVEVKTLVNTRQMAGQYAIEWDGTSNSGNIVPSGVYLYKLKFGDKKQIRRMIFLK